MNDQSAPKSWRYRVGKFLDRWWIKLLEAVTFVLVAKEYIPKKYMETGEPLIILLGITILSLILINYFLTIGYAKEISRREKGFSETIAGIKNKQKQRISELNEEKKILERKARYADIIPTLNIAFQELHNAIRRDHHDKKMYHEAFVLCCQSLEQAFSHVTGSKCHVCIKNTIEPDNEIPHYEEGKEHSLEIPIKTYCRSLQSSSSRRQIDQKHIIHLITENSDFEYIFRKKGDCFFCNDLAKLEDYKNSSFKNLTEDKSCIFFSRETPVEEKIEKWPLSYRATVVAPILPIIKEEEEDHYILGLLCVDSENPEVFNPEVDKHIMIGCADGIYNSFKKLFRSHKPSHTLKTEQPC